MTKKGAVVTVALGALVLAAGGYLVYDKWFRGDEQKQSGTASATLPDETPKPNAMFAQYQSSNYFPNSLSIPKGKPKHLGNLVNQCVRSAGVYYGSIGGLPSDFPEPEVTVACSAYILEELAKAGCSSKKGGAIYCNGKPVKRSETFEVVVDKSLENNVNYLTQIR